MSKKCRTCGGTGQVRCPKCKGTGKVGRNGDLCDVCVGLFYVRTGKVDCQSCRGSGIWDS
jgi:DnaJ-class molecular chaperone